MITLPKPLTNQDRIERENVFNYIVTGTLYLTVHTIYYLLIS